MVEERSIQARCTSKSGRDKKEYSGKAYSCENLHVNLAGGPQSSPQGQKETAPQAETPQFVNKVMPSDKVVISLEGKVKVEGESREEQSAKRYASFACGLGALLCNVYCHLFSFLYG